MYMQSLGVDPNTNQERFLSADNKVHLSLSRCPCCGATNTISHNIYKTMCNDCGKEWMYYTLAKSKANKHPSQTNYMYMYNYILIWYKRLLDGYVAPSDVAEQKLRYDKYFAEQKSLDKMSRESATFYEVACDFCGEPMQDTNEFGQHKCITCSKDWASYCRYRRRVAVLTLEECKDCLELIHKYVALARRGYWCPNTETLAFKVRKRTKELESM